MKYFAITKYEHVLIYVLLPKHILIITYLRGDSKQAWPFIIADDPTPESDDDCVITGSKSNCEAERARRAVKQDRSSSKQKK